MRRSLTIFLACSLTVASQPASAQDDSAAAERARLANQRIHAESERLARELERQQRLDAETQPRLADETTENRSIAPVQAEVRQPTDPLLPTAVPKVSADGMRAGAKEEAAADLSRRLEQLRTLGELWDAGYVNDEEFERIKRRILDSDP